VVLAKLDFFQKMFNILSMEMLLVKFLVNNKVDSFINKLPIHLVVLLKVNNMPVSEIIFYLFDISNKNLF
jgi:hypothetical protein